MQVLALALLALLSEPALPDLPSGWRCGMLVRDLDSGETLVSRSSGEYFRPASTVKLLTTLLAMEELGPAWVWRTRIEADPEASRLYLVGSGAPLLSAEAVVRASLECAAALPPESGVSWQLCLDTTAFAGRPHLPGWERGDWDRTYCPPVEPLCIGDNVLEIIVSTVGEGVRVSTYPPLPGLAVDNRLRTGARTEVEASAADWDRGVPLLSLEGTVADDTTLVLYKPFAGAPFELATWLLLNLGEAGVAVEGPFHGAPKAGDSLQTVAVMYSQPLFNVLSSMNKWSRNVVAEQVLRTVFLQVHGPPATTGGGCDMMAEMAGRLAPGSAVVLADGSGLSRLNRLTPEHLAAVLSAGVTDPSFGPEFLATLPASGRDGTLRSRMEDLPEGAFRGKTGTLGDTSTIAGLLTTAGGRRLVVVIMLEIPRGQVFRARGWQDRAVSALYSSL
jgi:D-alanyl-D-alanine carboxypeptidase/D-alanyl-D-alanine-endopeptidase (penicillin-binding protein 4)